MLSLILKPFRLLLELLRSHDAPWQIAAGFTLGALIGVMPKGNLIVATLAVLLCTIKVNRTAGGLGIALFWWLGPALDPLAHTVGVKVLDIGVLQTIYSWLYELPLGPWLGFNNTVVLGCLLVGLYFSYPVFWATFMATSRYQRWRDERRRQRELHQLVTNMKLGAQWGAAA